MESYIGRRVEFKEQRGTVRYCGPLQHETDRPKTEDVWLGIEWDNPSKGKHNGTVNGFKYFDCASETGGSLIRLKAANLGIPLVVAVREKYKSYEEMTEEEKKEETQTEQEMYANTTKKSKKLAIQLVGKAKAYSKISNLANLREVALQSMQISSVEDSAHFLTKSFTSLDSLYLDGNLLYDWEQYFQILWQLPKLVTISLTDNKFRKPFPSFISSLSKDRLVHPNLRVVSFIDMGLSWEDVDILLPSFELLEELWLCHNKCNTIGTAHKVRTEFLNNINMLNLESNGLTVWEDVVQFGELPKLNNLVLGINKIRKIPRLEGFRNVGQLSVEKNLIDDWESINNLNSLENLTRLRISDNPIENVSGRIRARQEIIARIKNLEWLNSSIVKATDRRDAELTYMKIAWEQYVKAARESYERASVKEELKDASKLEEHMKAQFPEKQYMEERHPRWFELIAKHGSPIEMGVEKVAQNIQTRGVELVIRSMCKGSVHKEPVTKKLPETMTVGALKGLCAKLFGVDVLKQRLSYHPDKNSFPYDLDDNLRQLGYYGVANQGEVWIFDK
eukprot:TRINITY_DN11691_c0_g1_i1.p1 TRINITY_DN11691_c0_g1~~TRINITY_DN11691_c0_g1_i1.p1  ORF type:complete len:563 (-),score=141.12 TRINITY_DN11691_c0_g1_i1:75-1763(-)